MNAEKTHLEFFLFMRHVPKIRVHTVKNRKYSSVMTVVKGGFEYSYNGGGFTLNEGETVFLPYNSNYSYKTVGEECVILQIVFNICDEQGIIQLCEDPVKSSDTKIAEAMERIVSAGIVPGGSSAFKVTADVYRVLSLFFDKFGDNRESLQIYPALRFIEQNYCEKISVEHLAKLCVLSQSQLRRLFNSETGMSPIEYKNSLRIKAACDMLTFSSQNISEISQALGFENPYIFSRLFKKYMNTSPLRYRKSQK